MIVRLEVEAKKSECMIIPTQKLCSESYHLLNDRSWPRYNDENNVVRFALFEKLNGGGMIDTIEVGIIHSHDHVTATKTTIQTRRRTRKN